MRVLLYQSGKKLMARSGIGRSMENQERMLEALAIDYTTDDKQDFEIVQLNTVLPSSFFTALKARLLKRSVIYYAHSTMEDFRNSFKGSNLMAPLFKVWIKACYNTADIIITPSKYSKALLESYGIKKEIYVISNGVDTGFYQKQKVSKAMFCKKYGIPENKKMVISVGHYIKRKGIIDFIQLAKRHPEYTFIWYGYTHDKLLSKEVKEALRMKSSNLFLPGYVSKEEVREAYNVADLFAFPSYEETEGMVVFEALSMKIPVLVRAIPIYEQMFMGRKAVHFGKDLDELSDRMVSILAMDAQDLRSSGYVEAMNRSFDKVKVKIKQVYTTLS